MHKHQWQRVLMRPENANKYDFGHVLILGGAPGMEGAALLAGEAALRAGAGLVTIASTEPVIGQIVGRVEPIMTFALPNLLQEQAPSLLRYIKERHVTVLAAGPGLPAEARTLIQTLMTHIPFPVVLDAGALGAVKDSPEFLLEATRHNPAIILTPHPGEFAQLTGGEAEDETAITFAKQHNVTVILKHTSTLVAHPKDPPYYAHSGNPGLATAGTGDVLTGIVAALLAQRIPLTAATEMAVYMHGVAGDIAAKAKTQPGMIATDVIAALPQALATMRKTSNDR